MKLSELKKQIESFIKKNGDMEVTVSAGVDCGECYEPVDGVYLRPGHTYAVVSFYDMS